MSTASTEEVGYLRSKAREWAAMVVNLFNTPVPPALQARKNALLHTAKTIKNTLESIFGGFSDLAPIAQHLGFIPLLVGGVAVAGAVAAIAKWISDYKTLMALIAEQQRLEAAGMTPQQAANVISQKAGGSVFSSLLEVKKIAVIGTVGFGLYLLYKHTR